MSMKILMRAAGISLFAATLPAHSEEPLCSIPPVQARYYNVRYDFPDMDKCVAVGKAITMANFSTYIDCVDVRNGIVKRVERGKVEELKAE